MNKIKTDPILASVALVSREFLAQHRVLRYRGKTVSEMSDRDVIHACHVWCEDNGLTREFNEFRDKMTSGQLLSSGK